MDLVRYIRELLYTNDKVVIPGIGGFVSTYGSANINFIEAQIYPPSKDLKFDPNLSDNDGVLVNYVVQNEKLTYKNAYDEVKAFVGRVEDVLQEQSFIEFEAIGKLYWDTENQLAFKSEGTNFRLESFGLPVLNCQAILRSKAAVLGAGAVAPAVIKDTAPKGGLMVMLKQPKKVVAVGGLLGLLLLSPMIYSYLTSNGKNNTDPNNSQNAAIFSVDDNDSNANNTNGDTSQVLASNDLVNEDTAAQDVVNNDSTLNDATNEDPPVDTTANTTVEPNPEPVVEPDPVPEPTPEPDPVVEEPATEAAYIVVVGAFEEQKNADRILRKLKRDGYTTDFKKLYTGLLRVGIQLDSKSEVKKHLSRMRRKYSSDAWVITL